LCGQTGARYTTEAELNFLIDQFYPALQNNLEKFLPYEQAKDLLQIIENAHEVILRLFKDNSFERYLKDSTAGFSDKKLLVAAYNATRKILTPLTNNEQKTKKKTKTSKPSNQRRKKYPASYKKEANERIAAKLLSENTGLTCRELASKMECDPATITRLEAWKKRGVAKRD
jgi:hypothetical protein